MSVKDTSCSRCANDSSNGGICTESNPLLVCFEGTGDGWVEMRAPEAAQDAAGATNAASVIPSQPAPVANANPATWDLVMSDMRTRDELGRQRYGVRLQPGNGRDTLRDAYEEALDLAVYLRTAIHERDGR